MMALDSMSSDVIAMAKDDRSADFTERFSKWGSADDLLPEAAGTSAVPNP